MLAHFSPLANHLWQSTLFAGVVGLLTLALRQNQARLRHRLWMSASVKFLLPFSLLVGLGNRVEWRAAAPVTPAVSAVVERVSQPFSASFDTITARPSAPAGWSIAPVVVMGIWGIGFTVVLVGWWVRWRRISAVLRVAKPLPIDGPASVMSAPTLLEPGVFGLVRPVLLLPEGIAERLPAAQLNAILSHEFCHIRRRDNFFAAVHMAVEAIFWFHPLVWWIGARLVEERENACDEEVLRLGSRPCDYAAGILNVCKFYLESPIDCASGVTGADLKKRIETIMTKRVSPHLTIARRLLLGAAAATAIAGPVFIGLLNLHSVRAQSSLEPISFEVASIKPSNPNTRGSRLNINPAGGLNCSNVRVKQLIEFAYDVHSFQISGAPSWIESQGFDIIAKAPESADVTPELAKMTDDQRKGMENRIRRRTQSLLADRFKLTIQKNSKEMPVYTLVVGKGGPKMSEATQADGPMHVRGDRGQLIGRGASMDLLVNTLSRRLSRPVVDRTGLTARYNFKLEWTEDDPAGKGDDAGVPAEGSSLFTALQEQLGLKLETQKSPVQIIVIDHIERPSGN